VSGEGHREALHLAGAEARARDRAERLSTQLLMERGLSLCEAGDAAGGLLWLARAVEAAPADPQLYGALRLLLGGWGRQLPTLRLAGSPGKAADPLALPPPAPSALRSPD